MANITDAEKIAHHWAERTVTAISWTGGLQFLVALLALCFSIWKHWAENKDEDKRRERAEDERRWGRMERRLERMEKAAQEAEARQDQAALQLERMVEALRYVRFISEFFLPHPALRVSRVAVGANLLGRFSNDIC